MHTIADYLPTEDEEYMNPVQLAYFEQKLRRRQEELRGCSWTTMKELQEAGLASPDLFDVATSQAGVVRDVQGLQRHRAMLERIEYALERIQNGEYGYCALTGEKIGLRRLDAQPTATLCVEAQEELERSSRRVPAAPSLMGMMEMAM